MLKSVKYNCVSVLWFKFFLGLKIFKPVSCLFSFIADFDKEYKTKKDKKQTGLKNFIAMKNLNHNIYTPINIASG